MQVQLLNTQLADCLEQLQRRESELESQDNVIKVYEETLVQIKQQMAGLYFEHDTKVNTASAPHYCQQSGRKFTRPH